MQGKKGNKKQQLTYEFLCKNILINYTVLIKYKWCIENDAFGTALSLHFILLLLFLFFSFRFSSFCLFRRNQIKIIVYTSLLKMVDGFDHFCIKYILFIAQRCRMRTCWMNSCGIFNVCTAIEMKKYDDIIHRCEYVCSVCVVLLSVMKFS